MEEDTSYILINDEDYEKNKFNSTLLEITNKIIENNLPNLTSDIVLIDFFTSQIYIWIQTILKYSSNKFKMDNVLDKKIYDINNYPREYINQLEVLCEILLEKLVNEKILKLTDDNFYIFDNKINSENEYNKNNSFSTSTFINDFIEFEKYLRGIYIDLTENARWDQKPKPINLMFKELQSKGAINSTFEIKKLEHIINLRNKSIHGLELNNEELKILDKSKLYIRQIKYELIESYTYFVVNKFLQNFKIEYMNKGPFDFIATKDDYTIVFEIKLLQNGKLSNKHTYDLVNKFINFNLTLEKRTYLVLFYYQENANKKFDEFSEVFYDILNNTSPELKDHVFLCHNSSYSTGDASTGRTEVFLKQIIDKIEHSQKEVTN